MATPPGGATKFRMPPWLGTAFVYGLSIGCLLWVYHDFDWRTELPRLQQIHWVWIVLAVATDILVYVSQAWRWNLLLEPVARIGLWQSVKAIYIGLFANEVLPLRSGELIRCYLQSHWSNLSLPIVLSSALIERLLDGLWLILGFLCVAFIVNLPTAIEIGAAVLAVIVIAIGALVLFAVLHSGFAHHVSTHHRWSDVLRTLVEGLHLMGRSPSFRKAALASTVYLFLQVIPIHAMMRGYDLDTSMADAAIVLVVIRLSTVVPGLPGNIGLFNAAAFTALHNILKVDAQTAKSLSAVMFFIITVPLLIAGSLALAAAGLHLGEIAQSARKWRQKHRAHHAKPAPPRLTD